MGIPSSFWVNVHRTFNLNFQSSFSALYQTSEVLLMILSQTSEVFLTQMLALALKELPNIHEHKGGLPSQESGKCPFPFEFELYPLPPSPIKKNPPQVTSI